MTRFRPATPALLAAPLAFALLSAAGTALADDAAMRACRAMPDATARLACYDAVPVGAPASATAPAASAPSAATVATAEQRFGMEQVRKPDAPVKSIESTIPGTFSGWGPNSQIRLANGQVWRVVDGSAADLMPVTDVKVKVVRNAFGTMFLEIDGTNNSPKVRRVQ